MGRDDHGTGAFVLTAIQGTARELIASQSATYSGSWSVPPAWQSAPFVLELDEAPDGDDSWFFTANLEPLPKGAKSAWSSRS